MTADTRTGYGGSVAVDIPPCDLPHRAGNDSGLPERAVLRLRSCPVIPEASNQVKNRICRRLSGEVWSPQFRALLQSEAVALSLGVNRGRCH